MKHPKVLVIVGTRPEAIKMGPVIQALQAQRERFEPIFVSTAQHREMLDQVLGVFGLEPDTDLNIMRPNQSLTESSARALKGIDQALSAHAPDLLLVQGDTNTVLAGSLAAHYNRVPVAHVEAGLRSHDRYFPFPEEMNRRLTSVMTRLHFAPTRQAKDNLLREGVPEDHIFVTGNTVVDALLWTARQAGHALPSVAAEILGRGRRFVLVTCHRRENLDVNLEHIALALKDIVESEPSVEIIYPVHLNPRVQATVQAVLGGVERVHLIDPVTYPAFVQLMRQAHLILTDSGGVQEEAPTFGTPVLVLRTVTERMEAIEAGCAQHVGVQRKDIVREALKVLGTHKLVPETYPAPNPFGDGRAAERIVEHIQDFFTSRG